MSPAGHRPGPHPATAGTGVPGSSGSGLVDTSNCELEPIRFPGAAQPHGALLVLSPDRQRIEAASESCATILGREAAALIGSSPAAILGSEALAALPDSCAGALAPLIALRLNGVDLNASASLNEQAQYVIDIEADPGDWQQAAARNRQRRMDLLELRALGSIEAISQRAAEIVHGWTGFDRVMIYRFDRDWNGEVIAEARVAGVEPYLGLHFPASDIPRQARELFKLSRTRLIPDVGYRPSTLLARGDSRGIDLGTSALRSVSPIHLEYLGNMGVRGSLVGALVVDGQLWGLMACHHLTGPKYFPPSEREVIGAFCEDLSAHIDASLVRIREARVRNLTARRRALVDQLRRVDLRTLIRQGDTSEVLDAVAADGFALVISNDVYLTGATPKADRVRQLLAQRRRIGQDAEPFLTHAIERDLEVPEGGDGIAGALFISLCYQPATTLIWFRQERRRSVRWAGDPMHPHTIADDGRISPRKSFATFLDHIGGQSIPWSAEERASGGDLGGLIEIEALRQSEAFLRTVLDSSPEHICVLDRNGRIITINAPWQSFGRANGANETAVSPLGVSYRQICSSAHGANATEASPAWRGIKAVIDGSISHFTMDYPCHSPAERRWFQMSVYPMRAPCEGVVVAHQNVTERILAQLALSASEQRYLGLLEDQTEVICRFKADGKILYVNDALLRLFGKRRELLLGNAWQPAALPEDLPRVSAALEGLSPTHPIVTIENRVFAADGQVRWIQFVNRGLFDELGQLLEVQAVGRDITDRKKAEEQLRLESEKTRALLRNASDGVTIIDTTGQLVDFSDSFCIMLGYSRAEMQGMNVRQSDAGFQSEQALMAAVRNQFKRQSRSLFNTRHRRKDGTVIDVEVSGYPVEIGGVALLFNSSRDISDRLRLDAERTATLDLLKKIANRVPGVVFQYRLLQDGTSAFPFSSDAMRAIYRVSPEDVEGDASKVLEALHPDDRATFIESLRQSARDLSPWRQEYRVRFDDGTVRWLFGDAVPQREDDGAVLWCGFITDVTDRKQSEQAIKALAFFDPLTRLPNRSLFEERLSAVIAASTRSGRCASVAVLDLDNFKPLNDQHGHAAGDCLLVEVARRVKEMVRAIDTVCRLGGDEFVVILPELEPGLAESMKLAGEVFERVRFAVAQAYRLSASAGEGSPAMIDHCCTVSIGFVVFRGNRCKHIDLVGEADAAMYRAKSLGRNAVVGVLTSALSESLEDRPPAS